MLLMRETTERSESIAAVTLKLEGTSKEVICDMFNQLL